MVPAAAFPKPVRPQSRQDVEHSELRVRGVLLAVRARAMCESPSRSKCGKSHMATHRPQGVQWPNGGDGQSAKTRFQAASAAVLRGVAVSSATLRPSSWALLFSPWLCCFVELRRFAYFPCLAPNETGYFDLEQSARHQAGNALPTKLVTPAQKEIWRTDSLAKPR